ncbi:MAG: hypothetical protein V1895_03725 [Parcubacteria group bacterium]
MARLLSIARAGSSGPTGRKRALVVPFKLGPVTLTILTVALVGLLALFFIISTTSTSAEGFELHSLEQRADELHEQNQQLEVDLSKLRSLDRLEQRLNTGNLNFVPVTKVTTLRLPDGSVAVSQSK